MTTLLSFMAFMNFMFYPLVVATLVAVAIEQIIRAMANSEPLSVQDAQWINRSMGVRKFFYRQAWTVNLLWLLGYVVLLFASKTQQPQMPDMIWKG